MKKISLSTKLGITYNRFVECVKLYYPSVRDVIKGFPKYSSLPRIDKHGKTMSTWRLMKMQFHLSTAVSGMLQDTDDKWTFGKKMALKLYHNIAMEYIHERFNKGMLASVSLQYGKYEYWPLDMVWSTKEWDDGVYNLMLRTGFINPALASIYMLILSNDMRPLYFKQYLNDSDLVRQYGNRVIKHYKEIFPPQEQDRCINEYLEMFDCENATLENLTSASLYSADPEYHDFIKWMLEQPAIHSVEFENNTFVITSSNGHHYKHSVKQG